jgi:hypothetical protein
MPRTVTLHSRQEPDGIVITYQQPIVLVTVLFLIIWIAGWLVGERFAFQLVLHTYDVAPAPAAFIALWLTFWTLAGIAVIVNLLWRIAGSETVALRGGDLSIRRATLGIPTSIKHYAVAEISGLRNFVRSDMDGDGEVVRSNCVSFTYRAKPVMFFAGIDPTDGQNVCDQLASQSVWLKPAVRAAG